MTSCSKSVCIILTVLIVTLNTTKRVMCKWVYNVSIYLVTDIVSPPTGVHTGWDYRFTLHPSVSPSVSQSVSQSVCLSVR